MFLLHLQQNMVRSAWVSFFTCKKQVIEAEHILDGSWVSRPEEISNAEVGKRLNAWLKRLSCFLESEQRTEDERDRLGHLLKVMTHLRPGLVQCYDRTDFPRTNNAMERTIRAIKLKSLCFLFRAVEKQSSSGLDLLQSCSIYCKYLLDLLQSRPWSNAKPMPLYCNSRIHSSSH